MDDRNDQPRASLRGKGREILLGQQQAADESGSLPQSPSPPDRTPDQPDTEMLFLTPEEAEAVLDFVPTSPDDLAFSVESPLSVPETPEPDSAPEPDDEFLDWMSEEPDPALIAELLAEPAVPVADVPDQDIALAEPDYDVMDLITDGTEGSDQWGEDQAHPLFVPIEEASESQEGLPLAERSADMLPVGRLVTYQPAPAVDDLNPEAPEEWRKEVFEVMGEVAAPVAASPDMDAEVERHEGGLVVPEGTVVETSATQGSGISDPFETALPQRQPSSALFEPTSPPDKSLLEEFIDDGRLRKLWQQIEALEEDLVKDVRGDRGSTDTYFQELLRARAMVLGSRENYDDARAIVYRIRADMERQRRVEADIMRYRPRLLNYYLGWGIALGVLFLLKELFVGVTDAVGLGVLDSLYFPMLLGVAGALLSGILTLDRHTTKLRDFDPIHISWYLINPLLGGVMGVLMFFLASIANEDLLENTASPAERAITYLLCVVAGMNQNNVLRQLNDLLKQFGTRGKS